MQIRASVMRMLVSPTDDYSVGALLFHLMMMTLPCAGNGLSSSLTGHCHVRDETNIFSSRKFWTFTTETKTTKRIPFSLFGLLLSPRKRKKKESLFVLIGIEMEMRLLCRLSLFISLWAWFGSPEQQITCLSILSSFEGSLAYQWGRGGDNVLYH